MLREDSMIAMRAWLGLGFWIACFGTHGGFSAATEKKQPSAFQPCTITIVESQTGWPVPMVELRTTHQVRFVSDNAGRIAFDLPELMGRETWFTVIADGYEVPADGFGNRGVRLIPQPGEELTVAVQRTSIAKRIGRITGAGLFAESQKLGHHTDWLESGVLGCDSVQITEHGGKLFWAWGDTTLAHYPLGIFHASSATTSQRPLVSFQPPLRLKFAYFTDDTGQPRGVAKMPGDGPTWLTGYVSLPDQSGNSRLVATYSKIQPPMDAYECGLCVWHDSAKRFEHLRTIWKKSAAEPVRPAMPWGHPVFFDDHDGKRWVLFGDPLPTLRCPATFEAWQDATTWETVTPQEYFESAADGARIKPHSGSIAWNDFRKRWVTVFMQWFGEPSAFGELWYAEADSPFGPWGPAVKILSHHNYTFYNPRLHQDFTPDHSPILLFEGTYTQTFAKQPLPTPRYDYNQVLYRLDLDDPQLDPARAVH